MIADDDLETAVAVKADDDDEAMEEPEDVLGAIDFGCFFFGSTAVGG